MTWTQLRNDWPRVSKRLGHRFPNLPPELLASPPEDRSDMVRRLARSHGITQFEAAEELKDWMYIESLRLQ